MQKERKDESRKVYFISTRNVYIYIDVCFKVVNTQIDETTIEVFLLHKFFLLKKPQNVLREIWFAQKKNKQINTKQVENVTN